jgi:predicted PurR-regulated permease PerM
MERYLPPLSERGKRWARFLGVLIAVWLFGWLALTLSSVLTPLVAGLAIAYIFNPVVTWLEEKRRIPRLASVGAGLVLILLLAGVLAFALVLQLIELADNTETYIRRLVAWFTEQYPDLVPTLSAEQITDLARQHGMTIGTTIYTQITSLLSNVGYGLSVSVLLPLYTFVFLLRFNDIVQTIHDHLPSDYRPTVVRVVSTIDRSISNFFRGRLAVCAAVGVLAGVGWLIVGVKHSLLLGALFGVLNLVPYLSLLALPPALIVAYTGVEPGQNWVVVVSLTMGVYVAVQALESFAITPIVESRSSGLHPVTTVVALLIGGQLGGLLGMLLAIPIAGTLKSLGREYLLPEIRRLADMRTAAVPETTASPGDGAGEPGPDRPGSEVDDASEERPHEKR